MVDASATAWRDCRRKQRSTDPVTALHYQLSATLKQGGFEAIVLVDDAGCLVAQAGAWALCEELAAFAPLLSDPLEIKTTAVSSRASLLLRDALVRVFAVDHKPTYLAALGGDSHREPRLDTALAGCMRILRA